MARKTKKQKTSKWIPQSAQSFIARRIQDSLAISLVGVGIFTCASMLSYKTSDPSLNTSVSEDAPIHNIFGSAGSHTADLLLQTFGLASFVLVITAFVWGIRLWKRAPLAPISLRITTLILTLLFASVAFSRIPSTQWLPQPYSGGAGGGQILNFLGSSIGGWGHTIVALVAGLLALATLTVTLPITRAQWLSGASTIKSILITTILFGLKTIFRFVDWVKHHNDASYVAPKRPTLEKKTIIKTAKKKEDTAPVAVPSPKLEKESAPIDPKVVAPKTTPTSKTSSSSQTSLSLGDEEWDYPAIDLLKETPKDQDSHIDEQALKRNAELLQNVLEDYKVEGEITSIHPGPVVTLYEFE
ncbi:MAG: DNA translocase FtsK 4TM domain-containing protein, partial [Bdellovibrionales bacterium]